MSLTTAARADRSDSALSLYHLLDPEVLANPYPLYRRLRTEDPVHWDPFLHAWVVTQYADVVTVLYRFSASRTPAPERLAAHAFTPRRVAVLREHIEEITSRLLDAAAQRGSMDVVADLGAPLPAIV